MSNIDIIRAWKDEEYRNSLTEEQRSQLPENPAGAIELSNSEMENLAGGQANIIITDMNCFPMSKKFICFSRFLICNSAIDACPTALICGIKTKNNCCL